MTVHIQFFSYFKELTDCATVTEDLPDASSIADLRQKLFTRFPKLAEMNRAMLIAVGVEWKSNKFSSPMSKSQNAFA